AALRASGLASEGDRIRLAAIECARGRHREAAETLGETSADLEADELLWLAALWERAGDAAAAARALESAAERFDPASAGQLLSRAATLLEPLDSAAAADAYRKALAARPEDRLSRGLLHALLRRERD